MTFYIYSINKVNQFLRNLTIYFCPEVTSKFGEIYQLLRTSLTTLSRNFTIRLSQTVGCAQTANRSRQVDCCCSKRFSEVRICFADFGARDFSIRCAENLLKYSFYFIFLLSTKKLVQISAIKYYFNYLQFQQIRVSCKKYIFSQIRGSQFRGFWCTELRKLTPN